MHATSPLVFDAKPAAHRVLYYKLLLVEVVGCCLLLLLLLDLMLGNLAALEVARRKLVVVAQLGRVVLLLRLQVIDWQRRRREHLLEACRRLVPSVDN